MKKELREAVERVKTELELAKDIELLVELAESYLALKGFPEEKEYDGYHNDADYVIGYNDGYSQAIQDCKQATLATHDKWYGAGYVDGQNALLKKTD